MSRFAGKAGKVMVGTTQVAEITSWSLDIGADAIDVTNFGSSGWKEFVAGLKEWSGSFEGSWDMTDTNGQQALQSALTGGTTVTLKLYVDDQKNYSGTALIKALGVEASVDDVVKATFEFQGTGALTYSAT